MASGPDHQRLTPDERANLVAYLDGELPDLASRAIATKLTQSVTARREIDALQKTWELLDHLPMPRASEAFTQRTLTEIERISIASEGRASSAARVSRRIVRSVLCLVGVLACFGLGLAATRSLWPDPTARLGRDLSVAEHLDEYRDVRTIEFLRALDESPEFDDDPR